MQQIGKRLLLVIICITLIAQTKTSSITANIAETPVPTSEITQEPTIGPTQEPKLKVLPKPPFKGLVYTNTSKIEGNYSKNGTTISLMRGNKVLGKYEVKKGKFSIKFSKQKPGSKLLLVASKEGFESSKSRSRNVRLQFATYGLVNANSTYCSGTAYNNSTVTAYLNGKKYGSAKAVGGKYKIKLKSKPVKGRKFVLKSTFKKHQSKTGFYIGGGWAMFRDKTGKYHRMTRKVSIESQANEVKKLFDYNKKRGIKSIVAMVPGSILENKTDLPRGLLDYSNEMATNFLKKIEGYGYDTLDLRDSYRKAGFYNTKLYYKYDHHWTIQSAFRGASYVADDLKKRYGFNLDPKDRYSNIKNFKRIKYKKIYRGSIANNKVPGSGYEDYTLMYPKFETNLTLSSYDDNKKLRYRQKGRFENSVINRSLVRKGGRPYGSYLYGYGKTVEIVNNMADNNLTALVISTSAGRPFSSFFSLYFKKVSNIDLQGNKFNRSVYAYEKELKPDVCILLYTPHTFPKKGCWQFDKK